MFLVYFAFILLLFLISLPIQCFIGVILLLTSGFPIFFIQKRSGKSGKSFIIYKFRTMSVTAEEEQCSLKKSNEASGPVFKIYNDPRFFPFGKFLSHTGLDELPQLFNVLKGDMSLIGPRPLPTSEARKLKKWQQERHRIKPGIISPWIFNGYHSTSFEKWMKSDIEYTKNKSLSNDITLFAKAIYYCFSLITRQISELLTKHTKKEVITYTVTEQRKSDIL